MGISLQDAAFILVELGYQNVSIHGDKVRARCQCTRKKAPTLTVLVGGYKAGVNCHRCRMTASLDQLVWDEWFRTKRLPRSMQIIMAAELDRQLAPPMDIPFTKLEFVPMGVAPARPKNMGPSKVSHGVQYDLSGKVAKVDEAKKVQEKDLGRFKRSPSKLLIERGFSVGTQEAFGICLSMWNRRVVFPVRDWGGELKGWSQRLTWTGDVCFKCDASIRKPDGSMEYECGHCGMRYAKYLHSKGFRKSSAMYGEWLHWEGDVEAVPLITEGMTDVMNLHQHGLRGAEACPLAVMGGHATEDQIRRLVKRFPSGPFAVVRDSDDPDNYPLLPDGIAAGDVMAKAFEDLVELIDPGRVILHVIPRMGDDAGDLTAEDVSVIRDWLKRSVSSLRDGMDLDDKTLKL